MRKTVGKDRALGGSAVDNNNQGSTETRREAGRGKRKRWDDDECGMNGLVLVDGQCVCSGLLLACLWPAVVCCLALCLSFSSSPLSLCALC